MAPVPRLPLEGAYLHAFQARVALEVNGITLFRRNTGLIKLDKRVFRAGIPGQCDLYGIANGGRHFEVECKRFGKLSPAQQRWREWCMEHRVPWLLLEVRKGENEASTIGRWVGEFVDFLVFWAA